MNPRFKRLAETDRARIDILVDGRSVQALSGDTLMVAMLTSGEILRHSEFGEGSRAGFCLMGACQDCWVWTAQGERLRACGTPVSEGLSVLTMPAEAPWNIV